MQPITPTDLLGIAQRAHVEIVRSDPYAIQYAIDLAEDDAAWIGVKPRIDLRHFPGLRAHTEYHRRYACEDGTYIACGTTEEGEYREYQDRLDWIIAGHPAYYALCSVLADMNGAIPAIGRDPKGGGLGRPSPAAE